MDNPQVVVDDTSPKQTVYIFACKGSTVQVSRTPAQAGQCQSAAWRSTVTLTMNSRGCPCGQMWHSREQPASAQLQDTPQVSAGA